MKKAFRRERSSKHKATHAANSMDRKEVAMKGFAKEQVHKAGGLAAAKLKAMRKHVHNVAKREKASKASARKAAAKAREADKKAPQGHRRQGQGECCEDGAP